MVLLINITQDDKTHFNKDMKLTLKLNLNKKDNEYNFIS